MAIIFDKSFLNNLLAAATQSPRLRQNYDLRNSADDTSQRMLNALQPHTEVPIHSHEDTSETVICLQGRMEEVLYEQVDGEFRETERHLLCPAEGQYGIQVPQGVWHKVIVHEPSVIFEAKDGAYVPASVSR